MRIDNEIIKALECLAFWGECKQSAQCPYYMDNDILAGCDNVTIAKEALDLINRKDAEIERLRNAFMGECMLSKCTREAEIASEARKEFAERLNDYQEYLIGEDDKFKPYVSVEDLNNLLAEMENNE